MPKWSRENSKLLFWIFKNYFCSLLVVSKSLFFYNHYCVSIFFSKSLLCVHNFAKLIFFIFTDYFYDLLVDSKSLVFSKFLLCVVFFWKLLLCGTLSVIVFTFTTIVSITDEDPRVVHGSVVLTESLLLWWIWNYIQKFLTVICVAKNGIQWCLCTQNVIYITLYQK